MKAWFASHRKTRWTAIALLGLLAVIVVFLSVFDWNLLRPALAREISKATGRPAAIGGDLKVQLFSWNPSAEVYGLRLDNPPWANPKTMFGAERIRIAVSLARLLRGQLVLSEVDLRQPTINLERDSKGRASWELGTPQGTPSRRTKPATLPAIRRLTIEGGKLHVVDRIRKLTFSGSLSAAEEAGGHDESAFKLSCSGSLNAKPFRLVANGGPLLDIEPNKPYSFAARLNAADIDLDTHVTVRKPFDLGALDIAFVITGQDLADVYYLTGLALPNTPDYRLAGTLRIDGTQVEAADLKGRLGSSDISGKIEVQTAGERPRLRADLSSVILDIVDLEPTLGRPAVRPTSPSAAPRGAATRSGAAREAAPPATATAVDSDGRLLPDSDLQVNRVRGMDADVTYRAAAVKAPKLPLKAVNLHLLLDNGLLTMDPLSFVLDQGKFSGKVQIDARHDIPVTDIDVHMDDIDLSEFKSATMKQAPLAGTMEGRFEFHGAGSSIHKLASASNGNISIVVEQGRISDAIAELTGINVLRGLGLLIAQDQNQTDIRCGIVDFKDNGGRLDTTTVYVDTSNVLITGRGNINLDSEHLDLALQGDPKKVRLLRLRSPITLQGTLLHPRVGINEGKLAEQAGVATALGVLLTPAAAALAFIDPGLAKNKDCSTVLAQADAGVEN